MNNKLVLATMVMAAVTGSTFANGLVVGQVEIIKLAVTIQQLSVAIMEQ